MALYVLLGVAAHRLVNLRQRRQQVADHDDLGVARQRLRGGQVDRVALGIEAAAARYFERQPGERALAGNRPQSRAEQ